MEALAASQTWAPTLSGNLDGAQTRGGLVSLWAAKPRLPLDRAHSPSMPELLAGGEGQEILGALRIWLRFHFQGFKMFPGQTWGGQRAET